MAELLKQRTCKEAGRAFLIGAGITAIGGTAAYFLGEITINNFTTHNLPIAYGALDIAGLSIAGLSVPLGVGIMGLSLYEWAKTYENNSGNMQSPRASNRARRGTHSLSEPR